MYKRRAETDHMITLRTDKEKLERVTAFGELINHNTNDILNIIIEKKADNFSKIKGILEGMGDSSIILIEVTKRGYNKPKQALIDHEVVYHIKRMDDGSYSFVKVFYVSPDEKYTIYSTSLEYADVVNHLIDVDFDTYTSANVYHSGGQGQNLSE